jgi:proton-dependent oligopeptide transporter, POT family
MGAPAAGNEPTNPLKEIVQPFVDLLKAPRALWGINLAYVLEGLVYFGMLGYLAMHFSDFIFKGVEHPDEWSHGMVTVLTAGITLSMVGLGWVCDKWGIRRALILAFCLLLTGRVLISGAPTFMGLEPTGAPWSPLHLVTMAGIFFVVVGYGLYQPSAYAAVKQFTTPKTAAMGFAMLYALMNLGGYLPTFAFLLRDDKPFDLKIGSLEASIPCLGLGIPGTYLVYTAITAVALVATLVILTRKTVEKAIQTAKEETARIQAEEDKGKSEEQKKKEAEEKKRAAEELANRPITIPAQIYLVLAGIVAASYWRLPLPYAHIGLAVVVLFMVAMFAVPKVKRWISRHPLADLKFFFFIFALIPVQTLFVYNWMVLPQYISRSYTGWIGDKFEIAANFNPILIFILVPIIAAATRKANVYNMMIIGTFVMAAPAFLLVLGPYWWTLFPYIVIMTVGEAMWQPRFLQYAAEIAPEGRTGEYMGVAQLPWFLTKVLAPLLLTGWMMDRYCPAEGDTNTQTMWLIYACIAMMSTVMLILAKGWLGKDFKTKA